MSAVTGLVLAGGQGRRMGGVDKGLQPLRGRPLVAWVCERLGPQVDEILVNANANLEQYAQFASRVICDDIGGFAGPLAGLHAGMKAATHPLLVTVPCDSPFLPADLVPRLLHALTQERAEVAVAKTGAQAHPVFALVRTELRSHLGAYLEGGGRKIDAWYASLAVVEVAFNDQPDAFSNINTRDELAHYDSAQTDPP